MPGPTFLRTERVMLKNTNATSPNSGHREKDDDQIEELHSRCIDGEFGRSVVACGVQRVASEENEQRLIDGRYCNCALLRCEADYTKDNKVAPTGCERSEELKSVFTDGLLVRVVKYDDSDDIELRTLWNVAKHDKDLCFSVGWTTLHSKIMCAKQRYEKKDL